MTKKRKAKPPTENEIQVLDIIENDPEIKYMKDIANLVGISKVAVWKICKKNAIAKFNRNFHSRNICKGCREKIVNSYRDEYCSRECRKKTIMLTIPCMACGKSKTLYRSAFQRMIKSGLNQHFYHTFGCYQMANKW